MPGGSDGSGKAYGAAPTREKRREMATYRSLRLLRTHKSKAGRRRVEDSRLYCFVGKGSEDQPFLQVTRSEYLRVWNECAEKLQGELVKLGLDPVQAFPLQREKHERMVYERLAKDTLRTVRTAAEFERLHGRPMTPHEQNLFARNCPDDLGGEGEAGNASGKRVRQMQMARVLGSIGSAARHRPSFFQEAWSALVGPVIAAEVMLESVDSQAGVAFCRCLNSALAHDLRRRRSLPGKLSDSLGLRIERIIFR
ncbi:MAG: hypothetical protein OHK005_18590 [Candidatus Methylacidiphilales bacterium]